MTIFSIGGRCVAMPPEANWREQLALMLGAKPRRIGVWAELGLYGALRCMADAGEATLPPDALLILASKRGTYTATDTVIEQMRSDLPMPLAFLQTQPGQLLAMISAQIKWQGNAIFVADTEAQALLNLIAAQTGKGGVLLGWVDEMEGGSSNWLRLHCVESDLHAFSAAHPEQLLSPDITHLRIKNNTLALRTSKQN